VPDSLPTVSFCTENLEDSIAYNLNTAIPESFYSASDQVHFYLDENLSQEIESPADFKFGQNDISIFIETAKTEPGFCAALTTIILEKFHKPTPPTEIEILSCSENGNAEALFSTTGIKDSLTSGNPDFGVVFIRNSDTLINLPEEIVTENTEITALVFNNQYPACMAFSEVIFTVLPSLQIDLKDRYFLCPNSSITLQAPENADYYQWSTGETTSEITVSEPGNYSLSVEKFQRGEICSSTHEFEVIASEPAELLSVEKEDWTNTHNKIKLNVSGSGNYQYSINGGDYQNEPVFDNLGVGEFQVSIRDLNGCNPVEFEVYLLMHPEFFTPNSDGINDYWQISQAQREPDMKIYIFDRYGKLLLRLDPFSQGWDGTFNGKIMPSNDYWFRVVREDSENYRGNFTLKR
jgi:gliding motility-associated-like protein